MQPQGQKKKNRKMDNENTTTGEAKLTTPLIYQALAKANKLIGAISKGHMNQQQKFKFRGIDDVYNELHPILAECDVFIIPEVVKYEINTIPSKSGGVNIYTRATIRHHFTTSDGSSITTTTIGEAMDNGDKGMNKAMSIALKYALLQLFTIPTEEEKDPDVESPEFDYEAWLGQIYDYLAQATSLQHLSDLFKGLPETAKSDRSVVNEASRLKAIFKSKEQ